VTLKTQFDRSPARIDSERLQTPPPPAAQTGAKSSGALRTSFGGFSSRPQPSAGEASSSARPRTLLQRALSTSRPTVAEPSASASNRPGPSGTPPALRSLASLKNDDRELTPEAVKLLKSALPHGGTAIQKLRERESRAHPHGPGDHLLRMMHGKPKPLKDERLEKFMAMAQADVKALAKRAKLSLEDAAELMRLGVSQGKLDKKLKPADQGHMMLALYSIREKHAAEVGLGAAMARHPTFKALSVDHAWRMVLDRGVSENEPGYVGGMFRGLRMMIQADIEGRRLDAKLLAEMHDHATQGVVKAWVLDKLADQEIHEDRVAQIDAFTAHRAEEQNPNGARGSNIETFNRGYRNWTAVGFGMIPGVNLSEAGFREMVEGYDPTDMSRPFFLHARNPDGDWDAVTPDMEFSAERQMRLLAPHASKEALEARADDIIQQHAQQIESAASGDCKLRVIARSCQAMERAHLFDDGNGRTVGFLMLNKLLLESGMAPAMFEDPDYFDGFSSDELVEAIKRGQATFASYAGQG
jgi:hypothetical protein